MTLPQAMPAAGRPVMDIIRPARPALQPTAATSTGLTFASTFTDIEAPQLADERLRWRWISIGMVTIAIALSAVIGHNLYVRSGSHTAVRSAASVQTTAVTPPQASRIGIDDAARVQQILTANIGSNPISAMVINLKTGQTSSVNADKQFVAASLYKLYVATAVYKLIDEGKINYNTSTGNGYSVNQCLQRMITVSDNDCGQVLGTLVGWSDQNPMLAGLGFTGTQLSANSDELTTPHDTSLLFKRLYDGTLLSPNSSAHFLDLLKNQRINNRLPAALPAGTVVAHKTGDLDRNVHDAGIVYSPAGDYVVTLMSDGWSDITAAAPTLANLSASIYGAVNHTTQP